MKSLIVLTVLVVLCQARHVVKRAAGGDQNPKVWDALKSLKGKNGELDIPAIQELYLSVKPGEDFPILADIPPANVDCGTVKPGFYANDGAGKCQAFDRCDINGNLTSYLCPNMTLFNQITLICDWWYNIDCTKSRGFYDYSNSRLYTEGAVLLDNQDEIAESTGAVKSSEKGEVKVVNKGGSKKKKSKAAAR